MLRRTFLFGAAAVTAASHLKADSSSLGTLAWGTLAWLERGTLWIRNLPDGASIAVASGHALQSPAFSPSGRWIAFSDGNTLRLVSVDGMRTKSWSDASGRWAPNRDELVVQYGEAGERTEILAEGNDWGSPLRAVAGPVVRAVAGPVGAVSPDGNYYASALGDRSGQKLFILRFGDAAKQRPMAETDGFFDFFGFTRDGQRLLYWMAPEVSGDIEADGLDLYSVSVNGQPVKTGVRSLVHGEMLALSPGGNILAATDGSGRETWTNKRIALVDLSSGATVARRLTGPDVSASHPAWSPDGTRLAWSQAPDADEVEKQQTLASGKKSIKLITGAGGIRQIPITPELRVGAGDDVVQKCIRARRIWTAAIDGQTSVPRPLTNDARYSDESPLWASDGSHILFARKDAAGAKSLWLMRNDGSDAREVAGPLTFNAGFYGYTPWHNFFDWSPAL